MNLQDILYKVNSINERLIIVEHYQDKETITEVITDIREDIKSITDMITEQEMLQRELKKLAFDLANKI